jgi:hypothetical protein
MPHIQNSLPEPPQLPLTFRRLPPAASEGRTLQFSRDGQLLMGSTYRGHSAVWNVETGELLLSPFGGDLFNAMQGGAAAAALQAQLAQSAESAIAELLSPSKRRSTSKDPFSPNLTPAGQAFAKKLAHPTGLHDFDEAAGKRPKLSGVGPVSPDGTHATDHVGNAVTILNTATRKKIATLESASFYDSAPYAFSPDNTLIAAENKRGHWTLWQTATGKKLHEILTSRVDIFSLTFSPDNRFLAVADFRGHLRLWDRTQTTPQPVAAIEGFGDFGTHLAFFEYKDKTRLAAASTEFLAILEVPGLSPVALIDTGPEFPLNNIAVSPDNALIAICRGGHFVELLHTQDVLAAGIAKTPRRLKIATASAPDPAKMRAAHQAARKMVRHHLDAWSGKWGPLLEKLHSLKLPKGARIVFNTNLWDDGDGPPAALTVVDADGNELDLTDKLPQLPQGKVIPKKELKNPLYQSSESPLSTVMSEVLREWLRDLWKKHGPPRLKPGWIMHDINDFDPENL